MKKPNVIAGSLHPVVRTAARELHKEISRNQRYVRRLRRIGASDYEIAKALGIKETDPVLQGRGGF